jgi:hypothetical protein
MVTVEIDTALAPDWRILVTVERSARIRREAASVSSKNSTTLAAWRQQPTAQVLLGLIALFQEVVRKIQRSHPFEIIVP